MMDLAVDQQDALVEICNVGMSKAAKQLSVLLNAHINIIIPKINLIGMNDFIANNKFSSDEIVSCVHQAVSKDLLGSILLVYRREHAALLAHSVIGKTPKLTEAETRACEQEAVLEIGNIMITSCMCAIVNMLSIQINLDLPRYSEGTIIQAIESQVHDVEKTSEEIILITTKLESSGNQISGYIVLILTKQSIDNLLQSTDQLLKTSE